MSDPTEDELPIDPAPPYDADGQQNQELVAMIASDCALLRELQTGSLSSPTVHPGRRFPTHTYVSSPLSQILHTGAPTLAPSLSSGVHPPPNAEVDNIGFLSFLNSEGQRIPFISNPDFRKTITGRRIRPNSDYGASDLQHTRVWLGSDTGTVTQKMLARPVTYTFVQSYHGQKLHLQYPSSVGNQGRMNGTLTVQHVVHLDLESRMRQMGRLAEIYDDMIAKDEMSKIAGFILTLSPPRSSSEWVTRGRRMLEECDSRGALRPKSQLAGLAFQSDPEDLGHGWQGSVAYNLRTPRDREEINKSFMLKLDTSPGSTFFENRGEATDADKQAWNDLHTLFNYPHGLEVAVDTYVTVTPSPAPSRSSIGVERSAYTPSASPYYVDQGAHSISDLPESVSHMAPSPDNSARTPHAPTIAMRMDPNQYEPLTGVVAAPTRSTGTQRAAGGTGSSSRNSKKPTGWQRPRR